MKYNKKHVILIVEPETPKDAIIEHIKRNNLDVKIVIVNDSKDEFPALVYIGEDVYEPRQRQTLSSKSLDMILGMSAMMGVDMNMDKHINKALGFKRPDVKVNIVEEFRLIKQKKSNLTRSEREWVQSQFYQEYKKI